MLALLTAVLIHLSSLTFTAPESSAKPAAAPDAAPAPSTTTGIHGAGGWSDNH